MTHIAVVDAATRETLPGIPTPLLVQQASHGDSREAYCVDGRVWYMRDDRHGYTATTYRRVLVEQRAGK